MADELVIRAALRDELSRPLAQVRGEVRALRRDVAALDAQGAKAAAGGLGRVQSRLDGIRSRVGGVHTRLKAFGQDLERVVARGARTMAIALGAATAAVGYFGLRAASQFQTTRLAFDALLGSVEKGGRLFGELQRLNLRTPFELGELSSATQLLLRYGIAEDRVLTSLKPLLDAAALSGAPAENLQRLALALGQVQAANRLTGMEARQFAEAGINAYAVVAAATGKTIDEVRRLGEAGQISAEMFIGALERYQGIERLQGGAEKLSRTLFGQLSNLKDAINVRLADAAQPLVERLTAAIPAITDLVGDLVEKLGPPIFDVIAKVIDVIAGALPVVTPIITAILEGVGSLLTQLAPYLRQLEPFGLQAAQAFAELGVAMAPLIPALGELLVSMGPLLVTMLELVTALANTVVPHLVPLIEGFADLMQNSRAARTVVAALLFTLLAYRALSSVIGIVWGMVAALRALAGANAAAAASGGAGGLGQAGKVSGKAVGALGFGGLAVGGALSKPSLGSDLATVGGFAGLGATFGGLPGAAIGAGVGGLFVGARRLWGDAPRRNLGRTMRSHAALEAATPGRRTITSGLRSWGVGPGSGHPRGTVLDEGGSFLQTKLANLKAAGGWGTIHDTGSGRHLHAQYGDAPDRPFAGELGDFPAGAVYIESLVRTDFIANDVDAERAFSRAIEKYNRDRQERRGRVGGRRR